MKITYFGEIADKTNKTSEVLEGIDSVEALTDFMIQTYDIKKEDMHIAVNHRLVNSSDTKTISASDEIAVLSPFAGG